MKEIQIGDRRVGGSHPAYFIADIAANHDGDLERAKSLIHLAAQAGAQAAKFQNFRAPEIVSDFGFRALGGTVSHQAQWSRSVFEVYQAASIPFEWSPILKATCDQAGIQYFSSPYDFEALDQLEVYFPAIKIGSGDITWLEMVERIAAKGKPVLLATGASSLGDVQRAVAAILVRNSELVLLQCNTNYTGSAEIFPHVHLNVLKTYAAAFPEVVLGLSDHTPGHSTVLGAIALGARVIEKHFTSDRSREGPDHPFSLDSGGWGEMVARTRELEAALGSREKFVAENEQETVIIQRRCLRARESIRAGEALTRDRIAVLRPATPGAIQPFEIGSVIGTHARIDIPEGEALRWTMLEV